MPLLTATSFLPKISSADDFIIGTLTKQTGEPCTAGMPIKQTWRRSCDKSHRMTVVYWHLPTDSNSWANMADENKPNKSTNWHFTRQHLRGLLVTPVMETQHVPS